MTSLNSTGNSTRRAAWVVAAWWIALNAPAAITITDPGQDAYDFTANAPELSGLAWVAGSVYVAVSVMDRNPTYADSAGAFTYFTTATTAGLHFTLTTGAPDVAVQMEKSVTGLQPGDWTTDGIMETRTTNGDLITVDAWVTDPTMQNRLFLRLRATEQ